MTYRLGAPPKDGNYYKCIATNRAYWDDDQKVTFEGQAKWGLIEKWGKKLNCWHDKSGVPVEGQIVRHWS